MGFSDNEIAYIQKEWGNQVTSNNNEYTGYSARGLFGEVTIPRRFNTPEGVYVRISDVMASHVVVRNISNSHVGLMNLKTLEISLTVAEFPKLSARKDNLCCHSNKGSYLIYKPFTSASEICIIEKSGKLFSSKLAFIKSNNDDYLCNSLAFHPNSEKEEFLACTISNDSGTFPAIYDVRKSNLHLINKDRQVVGHMIKFSRDGNQVITMATDEQKFEQCRNVIIMASHDLSLLFQFPMVPTMSTRNIDVIHSICGFKFAVFGNKRLTCRNETTEQKRPLSVRCWRHLCPVAVTLYRVTSPDLSLRQMCMEVISVHTDRKRFDDLPLPRAMICLLKSV